MADVIQFVTNDLYNMPICRLCGENNAKGYPLYCMSTDKDSYSEDVSELINKYLPLQISDDGKFPRWICPGCHLQVESTAQFFDLIITGQDILRKKYITQKEEEDRYFDENIEQTFNGENLIDQNDLYPSGHEMTNKMIGVSVKKKKKRGRPPKSVTDKIISLQQQQPVSDVIQEAMKSVDDLLGDLGEGGRRKRQIKIPTRYQEAIQGKELEKVFVSEGVAWSDDSDYEVSQDEPAADKLIGQLQTEDGTNLGGLVVDSNGHNKKGKRTNNKTKFVCDICNESYIHYERYMSHRLSHEGAEQDQNTSHQDKTEFEEHGSVFNNPLAALELTKVQDKPENQNLLDPTKSVEPFSVQIESFDLQNISYDLNLENTPFEYFPPDDQNESKSTSLNCETCQKIFSTSAKLAEHRRIVHNQNQLFVCNKCGKKFKLKIQLQRHYVTHSTLRPFPCTQCTLAFKTRRALTNHQIVHTAQKSLKCQICDVRCSHQYAMQMHMRLHSGEKPFVCSFCKKSFTQKSNMIEHMRIHTNERPFTCKLCGYSFKTSSQYQIHMRRHNNDRKYECPHCDKRFLKMSMFRQHQRRHNDERPFSCDICGRAFVEAWALRKHIRTHTGEKPYGCSECPRMFSDCSNLAKHRKTHQRKTSDKLVEEDEAKNPMEPTTWQLNNDDFIYITYQPTNDEEFQQQSAETDLIPSVNSVEDTQNSLLHVSDNQNNMVLLTAGDTANLETAASIFAHTSFPSELPNPENSIICDETLLGLPESTPIAQEAIYDDNAQAVEFIIPDGTKFKLIPSFNTDGVDLSELISNV